MGAGLFKTDYKIIIDLCGKSSTIYYENMAKKDQNFQTWLTGGHDPKPASF